MLIRTLIFSIFALGLGACGGSSIDRTPGTPNPDDGDPTSKNTPKGVLQTQAFASCQDLRDYYAESLAQEIFTGYAYNRSCFGCDPAIAVDVGFAEGDTASQAPTANPVSGGDREVSQTNTQEAGVDEADLIETNPNGTEIYVLRSIARELLVIETADPSNLQILARTALPQDREPRGMYFDVENQRLAVILTPYYTIYYLEGAPAMTDAAVGAPASQGKIAIAPPGDFDQGTQIQFYDVSNPNQPVLTETLDSDGQYVNSRRIDDRLHLITQFGFPYPAALNQDEDFNRLAYDEYPRAYESGDEAKIESLKTQIRDKINAAVANMNDDELLPSLGTDATGQAPLACSDILRPEVSTRMGLLLINSIDTDGSALSSLGTINNAWQIYASAQSLYLLQTSGGWWFDQNQKQQTAIYRFDIASGSAQPGAVGLVDGWIGNSYQLGEFEDHLRVSSTEGRFRGPSQRFAQANHLSVLNIVSMNTVGEVRDFVPTSIDPDRLETIRATRFVGPRGYVVTFQQTDPLFAFDLSTPSNPILGGQLEIPGFSTYIHPLSNDHLLTIGRAGGPDGIGTGRSYQLQLFDVSPAFDADSSSSAPIQLASEVPVLSENAYAYSTAEHNPLAFTFLDTTANPNLLGEPQQGLLSIPAQISSSDEAESLSGFVAYQIMVDGSNSSIREYARIDHKDVPAGGGDKCPPARSDLPPEGCGGFAPVIWNEPLRSAIIRESGLAELDDSISLLTLSSTKFLATDASGDEAQELDELVFDQ